MQCAATRPMEMIVRSIFEAKGLGQTQRVPVEAKTSLELVLWTLVTQAMAKQAKLDVNQPGRADFGCTMVLHVCGLFCCLPYNMVETGIFTFATKHNRQAEIHAFLIVPHLHI